MFSPPLLFEDPDAPRNVRLYAIDSHMAHMSWNHAMFNNKVVQAYAIDWSIDDVKQQVITLFGKNSYLFSGLMPGQLVSATVHAIPIWQFYVELKFAGAFTDTVKITMPHNK